MTWFFFFTIIFQTFFIWDILKPCALKCKLENIVKLIVFSLNAFFVFKSADENKIMS